MRKVLLLAALAAALPARADQTIHITYTEVPYKEPYAFLALHFEGLGPVTATHGSTSADASLLGFGLGIMSARDSNFQFQFGLGYRRIDTGKLAVAGAETIGCFDFLLGARLYPRKPVVALGSLVIRPTVSLNGGFTTQGSSADALVVLTAGFSFGFADDPNGLTAEFVYRPLSTTAGFEAPGPITSDNSDKLSLGPSWSIRVGFLFGP